MRLHVRASHTTYEPAHSVFSGNMPVPVLRQTFRSAVPGPESQKLMQQSKQNDGLHFTQSQTTYVCQLWGGGGVSPH